VPGIEKTAESLPLHTAHGLIFEGRLRDGRGNKLILEDGPGAYFDLSE